MRPVGEADGGEDVPVGIERVADEQAGGGEKGCVSDAPVDEREAELGGKEEIGVRREADDGTDCRPRVGQRRGEDVPTKAWVAKATSR
jgi:hypothetical protein